MVDLRDMSRAGVLSQEDIRKLSESLARSKQQAERKRRRTEAVVLPVGKHDGCGGDIEYRSRFVLGCPVSDIKLAEENPTREEKECFCTKCGKPLPTDTKEYRDQVEKYRNGK